MNYLRKVMLLLLLIKGGINLNAQLGSTACNYDLIYSYTFDTQADYDNTWGASSNNWNWVGDGTAANLSGSFWGGRPAISSPSGVGAVAISGDTTATGNSGELMIGELDFINHSTVYLRFNQYFRRYQSTATRIWIQNSMGTEQIFDLNQNLISNVETSYRDQQIIDITAIAANEIVNIRFEYEGTGYFWIIDDINFYTGFPCPETVPAHYGPILTELGYPYAVDEAGWPYVPNEVVVQFTADADAAYKAALRDTLGAVLIESCVCDSLELWRLGDNVITDPPSGVSSSGNTIGILERTMGGSSDPKVQGADPNYYTAAQLQALGALAPQPLTPNEISMINAISPSATDVRIAIIDTGVDFTHPDIQPHIRAKEGNCYGEDDILGRNFVQNHNNPQDDHSHGTHVAGIIAQRFLTAGPLACKFHLIPYKTHDEKGMSNLFDVSCATYQALVDEVSIINDSWGFYGTGSTILQNAINSAKTKNVLIVSAAGNDSISLDNNLLYPACYTSTNQLAVGSYDVDGEGTITERSIFSNYSDTWVDVAADGREVISAVPLWYPIVTVPGDCYDSSTQRACKTGTSMATPTVSAAAAIAYCERPEDFSYAIQRVLDCASPSSVLMTSVNGGLALNSILDVVCLTPLDPEPVLPTDQLLRLYPNPAQQLVTLSSRTTLNNGTLRLYSAAGKLVQEYAFDNWLEGEHQQIEMTKLPAGLYLIQLQTKDQIQTFKLIKD